MGRGCEAVLALGDLGPDECGCLLAFPVVQDGLDRAGDWREAVDDAVPLSGRQGPVLERLAPVVVVDAASPIDPPAAHWTSVAAAIRRSQQP